MKKMKIGDIMKNEKNSDIMKKMYVGFDIHEEYLTGAAMNKDGVVEFSGNVPNNKEAVACFLSGIPSAQVKIAIEACGLWRGVRNMLTDLGYQVVLANPVKTHYIVEAKDIDKVCARTLADLMRTGYLPEVHIPTDEILSIRDTTRHRAKLVRERQRLQCMIKSYLQREGIKYSKKWNKETMEFFRNVHPYTAQLMTVIEVINSQVKETNKDIKRLIRSTPQAQLIKVTPGIGNFSSLMIVGEISDINRFKTPKKLTKYAGLCPGIYQSGSKSHPVKNKACNKWLKWIMYVCSGRARQMDTKYKKHYLKVYRKKGKKIAKRSTARRMLTDVYYMLKYEQPFTP